MGGGGWVYLDYNVSSGPFLSFEIEIGDGPGPELDNFISNFFVLMHFAGQKKKLIGLTQAVFG